MKKNYLSTALFICMLVLAYLNSSAQSCSINEIRNLDVSYDSQCEGGNAVIDAFRYSIATGTLTWFRTGGSLPASAYTSNNQLYISNYTNNDAGQYGVIFTQNTTGCKDTGYVQLDVLQPSVNASMQWVQDVCGSVQMKAVNLNDTTASNNGYVWLDDNGDFTIYSQYNTTNNTTATVMITSNSSGCSGTDFEYIPQSQGGVLPARPGTISGATSGLCGATNKVYSINAVAGMTYVWSLPAGATISSGQGTGSIHVNFPSSSFSGSVSVAGSNNCGSGPARTLSVKGAPATPGAISGVTVVCSGNTGTVYSIAAVATASSYTWYGPTGSHIVANGSTSTFNSITTTSTSVVINFGTVTTTSYVKVKANNLCGSGSIKSLALTPCTARDAVVDEHSIEHLMAYPNPTTATVKLSSEMPSAVATHVAVTDMEGRTWLAKDEYATEGVNEYNLDLSALSAGIYQLQIVSEFGKKTIQVIKE